MKKLPRILLVVSVLTFVVGSIIWFSPINVAPGWMVIMPISPVTFGLFLITLMLEKETAQFDAETARQQKPACQSECVKCPNCKNTELKMS